MILTRSYPILKKMKDRNLILVSEYAGRILNTYGQFSKKEVIQIAMSREVDFSGTKANIVIRLLLDENLIVERTIEAS